MTCLLLFQGGGTEYVVVSVVVIVRAGDVIVSPS